MVIWKIAITCLATCTEFFASESIVFCSLYYSLHNIWSQVWACNHSAAQNWHVEVSFSRTSGKTKNRLHVSSQLHWIFCARLNCFLSFVTLFSQYLGSSISKRQLCWEVLACEDKFFPNCWWDGKLPPRVWRPAHCADWFKEDSFVFCPDNFLSTSSWTKCRPATISLNRSGVKRKVSCELEVKWEIAFTCLATSTDSFASESTVFCHSYSSFHIILSQV